MRKLCAALLISFLSMSVAGNVYATQQQESVEDVQVAQQQEVVLDVTDELLREGGRPEPLSQEIEELLTSTVEEPSNVSVQMELTLEEYIVEQIKNKAEEINIASYGISTDDIKEIYFGILNRHPELFFTDGYLRYTYYSNNVVAYLSMTYEDYSQEVIDKVYEELQKPLDMLSDDMTDVEKILFLHDYLCVNVQYSVDDLQSHQYHCIKGVAIDGKAVCEGYTDTFQYFMNELGIPCNVVVNSNHAWNQVEIDGEWYMIDVTHDDPTPDKYGYVSHKYFLKSSGMMTNRTWEEEDFEICDSTLYDDAFWNDTVTQLIYHNGDWYYINSDNMDLYCYDYGNADLDEAGTKITDFSEYWRVIGTANTYYSGSYSKLSKVDSKLVYTTPSKIYSCNFDGTNANCLATADTTSGYIYGMKIKDGQILYQISASPISTETVDVSFDLTGIEDIADADIQLSQESFYYNGEEQYPEITVTFDGEKLEQDKHYTTAVSYPDNGIGEVSITVTGKGYYKGIQTVSYEIRKGIQEIICEQDTIEKEYGSGTFLLAALVDNNELEYCSSDETVAEVDEHGVVTVKEIGTAVITILAPATDYYQQAEKTINIVVKPAQLPEIFSLKQEEYTYTGEQIEPEVEVTGLTTSDYCVSYENNVNAGLASAQDAPVVVITGCGNYTGEICIPFTIKKQTLGEIRELPQLNELRYGQTLQEALPEDATGSVYVGENDYVTGTYSFVNQDEVPDVGENVSCEVLFVPDDSVNYESKVFEVAVTVLRFGTAPGAPEDGMKVLYTAKTLSAVELSTGWEWSEPETALVVGGNVECRAFYTGKDKDNYEITEVVVTVVRQECKHTNVMVEVLEEATCKKEGTQSCVCVDCQKDLGEEIIPLKDHTWDAGVVTVEPTTTSAGCKVYTCTVCQTEKEEPIDALKTPDDQDSSVKEGSTGDDMDSEDKGTQDENSGQNQNTDEKNNSTGSEDSDEESGITDIKNPTEDSTPAEKENSANGTTGDKNSTQDDKTAGGNVSDKEDMDDEATGETIPAVNETIYDKDTEATYVVTQSGSSGGTVTYKYNCEKNTKKVIISGTIEIAGKVYKVTAIAKGAFKNDKNLEQITLSSNLITIGDEAFSGCKKLRSIVIPSKVEKIGKKAFYNCKKLKKITIKTTKLSKKNVGVKAFKGIYKKAVVKVPKSKLSVYKQILKVRGLNSKSTIKK